MDVFSLNQYFNYYSTHVLNMNMDITMFELLPNTSIKYEDGYNYVRVIVFRIY